jgi:hypothetical protein
MSFAEGTMVPAERSRAEIEQMLRRYGASQFVSGWDHDRALVGFSAHGRQLRFVLAMPKPDEHRFTHTKRANALFEKRRNEQQARAAYEQEIRRLWRALALVIKAKLEAVESGIATFEEEFMPWVVLPDGSTVGQFMAPQIARAYESGEMPKLLPGLPAPGETS